jgi:DNA-binding NarL/FixJ family response regulator
MPEKEGIDTIRELRRDYPNAKVVAMSGNGFRGKVDMLAVALHLGATGVLYQPFARDALLRAATEALDAPPEGSPIPPVG